MKKILSTLVFVLCGISISYAGDQVSYYRSMTSKTNLKVSNVGDGSGKVSLRCYDSNGDKTGSGTVYANSNETTITVEREWGSTATGKKDESDWQPDPIGFNTQNYVYNGEITASCGEGCYFDGFYINDNDAENCTNPLNSNSSTTYQYSIKADENLKQGGSVLGLGAVIYTTTAHEEISVRFSTKKFVSYSPKIGIVFLGGAGNKVNVEGTGCQVGYALDDQSVNYKAADTEIDEVEEKIKPATNSETGSATFNHKYYASSTEEFEFVGWATDENGNNIVTDNPLTVSITSKYEKRYNCGDESDFNYMGSSESIAAPKRYAFFRRKLAGYSQPCKIQKEGLGEISVNGTDWVKSDVVENLSQNIEYVSSRPPISKISVKYYAKATDDNYDFDGWYDNEGKPIISGEDYTFEDDVNNKLYICTYTYTPNADGKNEVKCDPIPVLKAKFVPNNYSYYDYALAKVATACESMGQVFVAKPKQNVSPKWDIQSECGNKNDEIDGFSYSYVYQAQALDGYRFVGWTKNDGTNSEGNYEIIEGSGVPVFTYTVTYLDNDIKWGPDVPYSPHPLYAVFEESSYFYHTRATVGLTKDSELGKVYVSNEPTENPSWYPNSYDDFDKETDFYTSNETSEEYDGIANDDENIIENGLNNSTHTYYYYATPSEKASFFGWSEQQEGTLILTTRNPYEAEYDAYKLSAIKPVPTLYAVFRSYYHTLPHVRSVGSGVVQVKGYTDFASEINDKTPIATRPTGNYNYYEYTLVAQSLDGAKFLGWSTTGNERDIQKKTPEINVSGETNSYSSASPHRIVWYAHFESDVSFEHVDRMIYYENHEKQYINDANIILNVSNAVSIKVRLSGPAESYNPELFSIADESMIHRATKDEEFELVASGGTVLLRLSYIGQDISNAVGKKVRVEVEATNKQNKVVRNYVDVEVVEMPLITFMPPAKNGVYTVEHTDGSGIIYTLNEHTEKPITIEATQEGMSYLHVELNDNQEDNLDFFGWQVIDKSNNVSYLPYIDEQTGNYATIFTHHFEESVTVRPEFVASGLARYIIKAHPEVEYYDLHEAIAKAKVGETPDERIIVVVRSGTLPKDVYDIPNDVTLLVPGSGQGDGWGSRDYRCLTHEIETLDGTEGDFLQSRHFKNLPEVPRGYAYIWESKYNYGHYKRLTVEDGTVINIKGGGNICVYAKLLAYDQQYFAFPFTYGHIELGYDAVINVENGGKLYSWGHITNLDRTKVNEHNCKNVGRIHAQDGAVVWETFAFFGFRGGLNMLSFVDGVPMGTNNYEVFPMSQYYVQNIEAPIIFESGASENLLTAVAPQSVIEVSTGAFIGRESGMFRWNNGTSKIIKFYDAYTDRIRFIIEDEDEANQDNRTTSVSLGSIKIMTEVSGYKVNIVSSDYVLPIQNNMDIILKSTVFELPHNIALMAGSCLKIDENSIFKNNAEVYVYDYEQRKFDGYDFGYNGPTNFIVYPIQARPYGRLVNRNYDVSKNTSASLVVDGYMDNSNGYLITTREGANITSNGGGVISIRKFGSPWKEGFLSFNRNQSAWQYQHQTQGGRDGEKFYEIPLSIVPDGQTNAGKYYPKLRNADNRFTHATTTGNYYYCSGKWAEADSKPTDCPTPEEVKDCTPRFAFKSINLDAVVGKGTKEISFADLITVSNTTNAPSGDRTWTAQITGFDANLFEFVTEKVDDKDVPVKLTFFPATAGQKKATLILTASYSPVGGKNTYVYTQALSLDPMAIDFAENALAFNDLTKVYAGQGVATSLFTNKNSNDVAITLNVYDENGEVDWDELSTWQYNGDNYTIQPLALAETKTYTIRAVQEEDPTNQIKGADISTTLIINPLIVWNWSELYYPSSDNKNPITMMNGATNWKLKKLIENDHNAIELLGDGPDTYQAVIADQMNGEYIVKFAFTYNDAPDAVVATFTSLVYRDPRHVRVDVNDPRTFKAVTVGAHPGVTFDSENNIVTIQSETTKTNAWTLHFLGTPDKLSFIPGGDKAWQIEESPNGNTWATTFSWDNLPNDGKPFEFSLLPSTQYIRINYGANGTATLTDVYITKLEGIKFDPKKLYMPAVKDSKKNVAITYVSDRDVEITSEEGEFSVTPSTLSAKTYPNYNIADVAITNVNCLEQKLTGVNVEASVGTERLPIQAYTAPQPLPIVLASDMPAERFYYVTPYYYRTTWNEDTRTITMSNAVASAQPYMVFYFDGTPSYISFNHTKDIKGSWIIEWSEDGSEWNSPALNPDLSTPGYIKQDFNNAEGIDNPELPSYIRVTYNSLNREKVNITNLMIIGAQGAFVKPNKLTVKYESPTENFNTVEVTAVNLANGMTITIEDNDDDENNATSPNFTIKHGNAAAATSFSLTYADYPEVFGDNKLGRLPITVYFDGEKALAYATITISHTVEEDGKPVTKKLATVEVTGIRDALTAGQEVDIYTGVPAPYSIDKNEFEGSEHELLSIKNAFDNSGNALFDLLYLFGETTTMDGTYTITNNSTTAGSNAKTPCYIYKKNESGTGYDFLELVENANTSTKVTVNTQEYLSLLDGTKTDEQVHVYISGFCPFTSTGYTKLDEGIFYFQGGAGDHVHVYLEHCFLYSRAKTLDGHHFEDRSDGNSFTENYARGSGAVLVFECQDENNFDFGNTTHDDFEDFEGYAGYTESERRNAESIAKGGDELYDSWLMWVKPGYENSGSIPFKVTIHTRGNNLLKSHYGCFLESVAGRAFQASSPVQIHLKSAAYEQASFTELNFDDIWPNTNERTNGKLKLQKRVNNAPSIDMGNDKTVVNFNGGQIELQNAQIVSHNYRSSLAICPRSGYFAQFKLAVGMGTDGVGGMVNFKDGTTTVKEMYVSPKYADCYLLDKDESGNYYTATIKGENCYRTTCIRAPRHTYVYGGSHGMMRACKNASSQGGAPTDEKGVPVGLYLYPKTKPQIDVRGGFDGPNAVGLVTPTDVPEGYRVASVTPETNGTSDDTSDDYLNFWFTEDEEQSVNPEVDKDISFWKTCMTEIKAEYGGYGGEVGGETSIKMFDPTQVEFNLDNQKEIVKHLLYCAIDENISEVIHGGDFSAYVKNPAYVGDTYVPIKPTYVGDNLLHNILNIQNYQVENKVYYIVPAVADVWSAFTAPFDVAKIYVMETYSEDHLDRLTWDINYVKSFLGLEATLQSRSDILKLQARQNAYFASFFAVTIALDQDKTFEVMYDEYMDWARLQDIQSGFWSDEMGDLTAYKNNGPRGMRELVPYTGSNWSTADFYLNKNTGSWRLKYDGEEDGEGDYSYKGNFETSWTRVEGVNDRGVLLEQGETYSMLFPYCTGCPSKDDEGNNNYVPENRSFYDYWTGKFLIFESREGVDGNRHKIHGSYFVNNEMNTHLGGTGNTAMIMGNSSFAILNTPPEIYNYMSDIQHSTFYPDMNVGEPYPVNPTGSFLVLNVPDQENVASVSMQGIVTYRGPQDTPTGGMTPTVGGGRDMFITGITGGINVAVASPQMVYVVTTTGAVIYSGYVESDINIPLPISGIYLIKGENEVQKIFY